MMNFLSSWCEEVPGDSQRGLNRRICQACNVFVRGLSRFLYEVYRGVTSDSQWSLEWKDLPSLRRLGRGLSGFVYETIWEGKKFARKDFPLESDEDKLVFKNEAKFLFNLDHPNLVKCIGYTVGKSCCSLLQEYVDDNLQNTIQKRTEVQRSTKNSTVGKLPSPSCTSPFEVPQAVDIISQIATAMEYLHEHQVVHGDLKPKNVLVCSEPAEAAIKMDPDYKMIVKVADYGLVQTKKRIKLESEQTRHFDALQWKAPELFLTDKTGFRPEFVSEHLDDSLSSYSGTDSDQDKGFALSSDEFKKCRWATADVYSFAVTCTYILTGEALINSATERRKRDFEPELPSACPRYLKNLIYRCLKFEALSRPTFSDICQESVRAEMTSEDSHVILRQLRLLREVQHEPPDLIGSLPQLNTLRMRECECSGRLKLKSCVHMSSASKLGIVDCISLTRKVEVEELCAHEFSIETWNC